MLSSRLRWRALAVLGALLSSVMIEWPSTGFAMPAANINKTTTTATTVTTATTTTTFKTPSQMTNFTSNNNNCIDGKDIKNFTYICDYNSSSREFNLCKNCSASNSSSYNLKNYSSDNVIDSVNHINNNLYINMKKFENNSDSNIRCNSNSTNNNDCSVKSSETNLKISSALSTTSTLSTTSSFSSTSPTILITPSSSSLSSSLSSSSLSPSTLYSEENFIVNRIKKISNNNYSKRKRKKNKVFHVTSEALYALQTFKVNSESLKSLNNDNDGNNNNKNDHHHYHRYKKNHNHRRHHNDEIMFQDSTFYDVTTTIVPIINDDNSTVYHYLSRTDRSIHSPINNNQRHHRKLNNSNLDRNERSTNLSHISGPARKIQLYIKNRFIQLLPDGTINGTQDDLSDYTILQRTTVDVGQIKIQGVATCLYLCMDPCGMVYGSKVFTDDCVFNESMEQHHYNTYSSTFNSNSRRILYLALNRHGEPRKLQIPPTRPLGKLATYTKALTETVPQERVEQLIARTFGANRIKHGLRQLCDGGKPLIELTVKVMKEHPKCNINSTNNNISSNSSNSNNSSKSTNNDDHNNHHPASVSGKLRISSNSTNSNNVNSNNNSTGSINSNGNLKKKKKKRRCKPDETEGSNCRRSQGAKKRPHKGKCPPEDEACHLSRKKKKQHHHQQHQQHQHQQQQQQQHHHHQNHQLDEQNGGGNQHRNKKKSNGQHHHGGKKVKNSGRTIMAATTTTTTTSRPTQTSTIVIQTTTSQQTTSNEQQDFDGESDTDDLLTAGSMEDDEEEDISSIPSIGEQTQLVGGVGDDFFYDNDYDVFKFRMSLWRWVIIIWITIWSLQYGRSF